MKSQPENICIFLARIRARVAERLGVHATFVYRVANSERASEKIQAALDEEFGSALAVLKT